jgi:hypothetical protein
MNDGVTVSCERQGSDNGLLSPCLLWPSGSSPSVPLLCCATNGGALQLMDARGALHTVASLPAGCFSSPVFAGGRLLVGCRDDRLHCLKLTEAE